MRINASVVNVQEFHSPFHADLGTAVVIRTKIITQDQQIDQQMDRCDQFLFIHFTPWNFNDNNADFNKITRAIYTLTECEHNIFVVVKIDPCETTQKERFTIDS